MWVRVVKKGFREMKFDFFDLLVKLGEEGRKERYERKKTVQVYLPPPFGSLSSFLLESIVLFPF